MSGPVAPHPLARNASFSRCGRWRHRLGRRWADGPTLLCVMLNPSTADAAQDDPTIRRCMAFASAHGFGALEVVNLFAWCATHPADLWHAADPVGPGADRHLARAAAAADAVCVAWGAQPRAAARVADRVQRVLALLRRHHAGPVLCLGTTRDGHPRHPLYLRRDSRLRPLDDRSGAAPGASTGTEAPGVPAVASAIAPATRQAFHETDYTVHHPDAAFTLRIGSASPALAALHRAHGVSCSLFITAWNPGSRQTDAAGNAHQHAVLRRALLALGAVVVDAIGQHPTNGWPGEDSLLALGMDLDRAQQLGRRFGQDAVLWCGADVVPRLVLLR